MSGHSPSQASSFPSTSRSGTPCGPNTFPALRLHQDPTTVSLASTEGHRQAIIEFSQLLHSIEVPLAQHQLPELDPLREAHPGDTEGFRRLSQTRENAHHTFNAEAVQAEQLQRWKQACAILNTLPAHCRFSQVPANLHSVLQRFPAAQPSPLSTEAAVAEGSQGAAAEVSQGVTGEESHSIAVGGSNGAASAPQIEIDAQASLSDVADPPEHSHGTAPRGREATEGPDRRHSSPLAALAQRHNPHSITATAPVVVQVAFHSPDAHFTKTQTLLAACSHTLAQLKDAIECKNDRYAADELGPAGSLRGGIFYLGGTIYADTRPEGEPSYIDYLPNLLEFFEKHAAGIRTETGGALQRKGLFSLAEAAARTPGPMKPVTRSMHDVRIGDLDVSVAQPGEYLYLHAGACEHFLVIEDVRIAHVHDPDVSTMPRTVFRPPRRLEKCCICSVRPAVMVAFDDVLAPESPAFFCELCFDDLHLDEGGQLLPGNAAMDTFAVY